MFTKIPTELEVIILSLILFQLDTMRFPNKKIYVNHNERAVYTIEDGDLW